ncbi:MAG: hypothetical protein H6551_06745 [Chitinophagales bacterium]|nr:hypothetical protein [Chitinophagaceae bacterium]MCB9064828.1 hypothetical protein [Chitinophagales bacterium]
MNDNQTNLSRYRWLENGHILLWLIKDTCWALEFKIGGVIMIVPTVSMAFYILWRSRHVLSERFHNIAVCFWIMANSIWMIGEFVDYEARPIAVVLFGMGLFVLAIYYLFYFRKEMKQLKVEETV